MNDQVIKPVTKTTKSDVKPPVPFSTLLILDGFGVQEKKEGNAVANAKTPVLDMLWSQCPHALLKAAGNDVGLAQGEPGNSEVGHLNIGAGQIVYQSLPRIDEAIRTGKFASLPVLNEAFAEAKKRKSKIHLMGILSAGGVHGHIEHLFKLMEICRGHGVDPYIHVILDGRDAGLRDGYIYLNMLKANVQEFKIGKIASICGRQYSMDRDHRWERTEAAYNAMVGKGQRTATDPIAVLQEAYKNKENDQTFTPTTMLDDKGDAVGPIQDNDVVIFYNYREDRARQITKAFVLEDFDSFERKPFPKNLFFLTMTGYENGLPVKVLFEPHLIKSTLSSIISEAGYSQLHMAETEKYAHISYFFNGGIETPHKNEEFFNIPSPKVFDYSTTPAMSAEIIRDEAVYRIESGKYNFILINFANPDMVGHTGNFEATVKALETVDKCLGDIIKTIVKMNGTFIVTGDHGKCEQMIDEVTGEVNTAHTSNPVPVMICKDGNTLNWDARNAKVGTGDSSVNIGILADVAPTILDLMSLKPSEDMTGIDLLSVIGPKK